MSAIPALCADARPVLALSVFVAARVAGALVTHGAGPALVATAHAFRANSMWTAVQRAHHYGAKKT